MTVHHCLIALGALLLAAALRAQPPEPSGARTQPAPAHVLTLWRDGDAGGRLEIRGQVLDARGEPVAGAEVSVRQADGSGEYTGAYSGSLVSNARGEYVLRTARPGNYGIAMHIHVAARHPQAGSAYTEIRFKGDPLLAAQDASDAIALETVRLGEREHEVGTFDIRLGAR